MIGRSCAAVLLLVFGLGHAAERPSDSQGGLSAQPRVHVWERWEASLTSSSDYANPYAEVELRVEFVGPAGQRLAGRGFWDGERRFKIRWAFGEAGTWRWRTICSDAGNAGLHDQGGSVEAEAYKGSNALYRHGFLKVSENARYLAHQDGRPFLWLGDTPWAAFIAATQGEWESYVQERRRKEFTVLQLHCGDGFLPRERDRDGNPPFSGSGESLQWNPAYWQGVEEKVQYANEQGIVCFICAVRQPAKSDAFPWDDAGQVRLFAQNLAARLMGNCVVYSPVADDLWTSQADECGEALRSATSRHLVTAHPRFFLDPAKTFLGKSYTDFGGTQTGAGWIGDPYFGEVWSPWDGRLACRNAIEWPQVLRGMTPRKPVLALEGVYDGERIQEQDSDLVTSYPARLPRSTAWLTFLSGAMGYTYGCFQVWNWGVAVNWMPSTWDFETALSQPSSTQMRYFAEFLSGIEWWRLEPRHDLIRNQSADWLRKMVLSSSASGDLAVAYLPDNPNITLDMSSFAGPMTARWFDPVTNASQTESAAVVNAGCHTFVKPDEWADAVLILSRGTAATDPGSQLRRSHAAQGEPVMGTGSSDPVGKSLSGDERGGVSPNHTAGSGPGSMLRRSHVVAWFDGPEDHLKYDVDVIFQDMDIVDELDLAKWKAHIAGLHAQGKLFFAEPAHRWLHGLVWSPTLYRKRRGERSGTACGRFRR